MIPLIIANVNQLDIEYMKYINSTELKAYTSNDRYISRKMILATSGNDAPSFNPTTILI